MILKTLALIVSRIMCSLFLRISRIWVDSAKAYFLILRKKKWANVENKGYLVVKGVLEEKNSYERWCLLNDNMCTREEESLQWIPNSLQYLKTTLQPNEIHLDSLISTIWKLSYTIGKHMACWGKWELHLCEWVA